MADEITRPTPRGYDIDRVKADVAVGLKNLIEDRATRKWCVEQAVAAGSGPAALVGTAQQIHEFITESVADYWKRLEGTEGGL